MNTANNYQRSSVALLSSAIATGSGETHQPVGTKRTFHARGSTSAGAGAADVVIEVSNTTDKPSSDTEWLELGTISLTLSTTESGDGFASDAAWRWVRARVDAISGTDAEVSCEMGA